MYRSPIAGADTTVVPRIDEDRNGAPSLLTLTRTNCGGTAGEEAGVSWNKLSVCLSICLFVRVCVSVYMYHPRYLSFSSPMCMSLCWLVCLCPFSCLCIFYIDVYVCVSVYVCLSVDRSIYRGQSVCLSVCQYVYLSVCLSVYRSIYPAIYRHDRSVCLSVRQFVSLPACLSVCLFAFFSVCLSVWLSVTPLSRCWVQLRFYLKRSKESILFLFSAKPIRVTTGVIGK